MTPSDSEPERYAELSRQYIARADEYLRLGDRVQASEKGWGAVAEEFKSIAEQRGWNHQGHRLLNDVAFQSLFGNSCLIVWEAPTNTIRPGRRPPLLHKERGAA